MEIMKTGGIANPPNLKEGMIPVKWDASNKTWVKADKTNTNRDWYDYSTGSKKWANVVTVKATGKNGTTRAQYKEAEVGTAILEEDITTMFVWIPRYSYKITKNHHTAANGTGEIKIEFLLGKGDNFVSGTGEAKRTSVTNGNDYVVHPAFTADTSLGGSGKEITGFWVGKFESSNSTSAVDNVGLSSSSNSNALYGIGDGKNVTIRPNVTSWRAITVSNIFKVCQAMNADNNIHGLESDTVTTMMQNSGWGAVAYLAQSDYGNKQVLTDNTSGIWSNSYYEGITTADASSGYKVKFYGTTLTGMTGIGIAGETNGKSRDNYSIWESQVQTNGKKVSENGESITIAYNKLSSTDGSITATYTNTYYRYYTENGQKASTTRNIYGIYDMSGGAWEYMASYLENGNTNALKDFKDLKIDEKYQTAYKGTGASNSAADRTANYEANQDKYGDALWETSNGATESASWNDDYSGFPYFSLPFFVRGGFFGNGASAGVFAFGNDNGGASSAGGFRVVAL